MPQRILEKHPEQCFTIPMTGPVRSLNLSTAVGIVLYEAIRQTHEKRVAADERSASSASDAEKRTTMATDEHG
jgi:tRNA C32,U32 (ribose-2'-O)-methylase TrmJ